MKKTEITLLTALMILAVFPILLVSSYSQTENTIYVIIDKSKYYKGDIITIRGEVPQILEEKIFFTIRSQPSNDFVGMLGTIINTDKTFTYELTTDSPIISDTGTYTINISYNGNTAETTFEYIDESPPFTLITLQLDKTEYYPRETIIINGEVIKIVDDYDVLFQITEPDGTITTTQTEVILDRYFTYELLVKNWDYGEYTLYAEYVDSSDTTTFEIIPSTLDVTLDNVAYYLHDTIIILGSVSDTATSDEFTYVITDTDENLIEGGTDNFNSDKSIYLPIELKGIKWNQHKSYLVNIYYSDIHDISYFITIRPEINIDQSEYYKDNVIITGTVSDQKLINGTMSYEISTIDESNNILSTNNVIMQGDTFSFKVDDNTWEEGEMELMINIGDYTAYSYFYYYDTDDITNNTLHEMIMEHHEQIETHEPIIYVHDDMLNQYNQTMYKQQDQIIFLQALIDSQQIQYDLLENEFQIGLGWLAIFNFTLGEQYPVVFDGNDISKINNEFEKNIQTVQLQDGLITKLQFELDQAIDNGNPNKIEKYEASLGSAIATREFYDNQLKGGYLFMEVYPQP